MAADTRAELDAMALRIGLRLAWRQKSGTTYEHYDVTPSKRGRAIDAGALEVSSRDLVRMMRAKASASLGSE